MTVGEHDDCLVLRSGSYTQNLLIGLLCISCGAFLSLSAFPDFYKNSSFWDLIFQLLTVLLSLGIIVFGVFLISSLPSVTTFDRVTQQVTILTRRFFRKKEVSYSFWEVNSVELVTFKPPGSVLPAYNVVLVISCLDHEGNPNEKRITISGILGKERQRAIAEQVAILLGRAVLETKG